MKDDLPNKSILGKELFIASKKGQKWVSGDVTDHQIIIDQDVITAYEVVRIWYSKNGKNNVFFTFGKDIGNGGMYIRRSSMDRWITSASKAFPITLFVKARVF